MNPIHFQFVTTTPDQENFTVERLFDLLDGFDVRQRDWVLMPAYLCFELAGYKGPSETFREDMYEAFKEDFSKAELQGCEEEKQEDREMYAVFGLISYVLVKALAASRRGEWGSFEYNQKDGFAKYEEGLKGDETSREKAMGFSVWALKTLKQMHHVNISHRVAYSMFCRKVVEPLLTGEDAD